ncbi:Glycyl-glycine endopeptidase LytM precursor [Acinetobacter stercoris]|uniref:Glycyl-glycine endopeptidase LytM n=1 Tax=Acinetobacter stercoris TaxID=2126983 RepID=A0A2U3N4H6_9GAMM|nr:Glycyl-glycine endopeptidase LytM precursor [Acinetobacter stercoris]
MVDNQKTNQVNISLDETIKLLNGTSISEPQPKLLKEQDSSKNNQSNTTATIEDIRVGGDDSWHDPLAICKLRTAGLASAKGATFGKVRNNGKTNHQGVDLQANPGTTIYAVCSGIVVVAENTNGAYGNVVVIKVNIDDLPEPQQKNAKSKLGEKKFIFFFYAHLSNISVSKNDPVKVGDALGATGSTGNANTMTTIANGAHLHFEARSEARLGLGLSGRIDPIPFLSVKLAY